MADLISLWYVWIKIVFSVPFRKVGNVSVYRVADFQYLTKYLFGSSYYNQPGQYYPFVVNNAGALNELQTVYDSAIANPNITWADWGILAGSFGWFSMWFLLFAKSFPIVAIQEIKEMIPMPRKRAGGRH